MDVDATFKMSIILRESTLMREIHAKIDNQLTEHIHYYERFLYY